MKNSDSVDTQRHLTFKDSALAGLRREEKRLDCKYFYDERGSRLFDRICELDEYYLTNTELSILNKNAVEIAKQIGERVRLVEYGSGSSTKTRILLDHLQDVAAYIPVDISGEHLDLAAESIRADYPSIEVLPLAKDFTREFALPLTARQSARSVVFFPGSTIGNFEPDDAERLLALVGRVCGGAGGLLIGIDLVKDRRVLELAYNDPGGVTAEFNLNLLHRLKSELGAKINLAAFSHLARYNDALGRIEIFIRSDEKQEIQIGSEVFEFAENELIHTEYSHKYTVDGFAELADRVGLSLQQSWTDKDNYFAVLYFSKAD